MSNPLLPPRPENKLLLLRCWRWLLLPLLLLSSGETSASPHSAACGSLLLDEPLRDHDSGSGRPDAQAATPWPVVTDKLTAEDPDPLEPGQVELELFYFDSSGASAFNHQARAQVASASLSVGLVPDLDLSLLTGISSLFDAGSQGRAELGPLQGPARGSGLTELEGELRWRFYHDPDKDLSLAYVAGITQRADLQLGSRGFTSPGSFVSFDQSLVGRKNWGLWTLDAEAYASFPVATTTPGRYTQFGLNLAVGYQVAPWLQPVAELGVLKLDPIGVSQESLSGTLGLILTPLDNLSLYFGYQETLANRNSDQFHTWLLGTSFQL